MDYILSFFFFFFKKNVNKKFFFDYKKRGKKEKKSDQKKKNRKKQEKRRKKRKKGKKREKKEKKEMSYDDRGHRHQKLTRDDVHEMIEKRMRDNDTRVKEIVQKKLTDRDTIAWFVNLVTGDERKEEIMKEARQSAESVAEKTGSRSGRNAAVEQINLHLDQRILQGIPPIVHQYLTTVPAISSSVNEIITKARAESEASLSVAAASRTNFGNQIDGMVKQRTRAMREEAENTAKTELAKVFNQDNLVSSLETRVRSHITDQSVEQAQVFRRQVFGPSILFLGVTTTICGVVATFY